MSASPVRVTGIEVVEDGTDILVTLHTADGPRLYVLDETLSSGLEGTLSGLRTPADVPAGAVRCPATLGGKRCGRNVGHVEQHTYFFDPVGEMSWALRNSNDGFEAFGVGEAA